MIAHLSGTLFRKTPQSVIIDINGIGYEVVVPLSTFYALPEEGERADLYIHTHVREDALTLFGFQRPLEKKIFLLLIAVSGIGPKLASNILSGIGPEELLRAMAEGDAVRLQAIPGIGKKTAERIALELKERARRIFSQAELPNPPLRDAKAGGLSDDAVSALTNLGYAPRAARSAVEAVNTGDTEITLEGLIRAALKALA